MDGGWVRPGPEFCDSAACVETRDLGDRVQMRDSKDPGGPVLTFDRAAWGEFLAMVDTIGCGTSGGT